MASSRWLAFFGTASAGVAMIGAGPMARADASAAAMPRADSVRAQTTPLTEAQPQQPKHYQIDPNTAVLKLVQIVFRHGARTPLSDRSYLWAGHEWDVCGQLQDTVPTAVTGMNGEPHPCNEDNEKQVSVRLSPTCHKGELTLLGQEQALGLGKWLRSRYVDQLGFLPPVYQAGVLSCRSTNFQRTLATLAYALTGLYPATTTPVAVKTSQQLDEIMYADTRTCPHLGDLMRAAKVMVQEQEAADPTLPALKATLAEVLHIPESDLLHRWMLTDVHDVVTSMAAHGKKLPQGLTEETLDKLNAAATREFRAFFAPSLHDAFGHDLVRLSVGRLLYTLLENMAHAAAGQPRAAMCLFSGHDSTVLPIITALGADVSRWPPYLSNVVVELWEVNPAAASPGRRHAVRVLYNQQEMQLPKVPAGYSPDLDTFKDAVLFPFVLSHQDHLQACSAAVAHDAPLPLPSVVPAAANQGEGEQ